jgi:hypothetical protein
MNNVVRIDLFIAVRNLRVNWNDWDIATAPRVLPF